MNDISGVARVSVETDGYLPIGQNGMPDLPMRIVNVLLPQGETLVRYDFTSNGRVVVARDVEIQLTPAPATENGKKGHGEPAFALSGEDDVFPPSLGKYLGTGHLHGYTIASFAVFPVRHQNGTLTVEERITLEISTSAAAEPRDIATRQRLKPRVEKRIHALVSSLVTSPELVNGYDFNLVRVVQGRGGFQPTSYPSLEGSPVDYLIITNETLASEYQRLADWKTDKGVPTVVRTTEWIEANCRNGVDLQETIRFFIRDAYEKWGVEFVLLGGDTDVIPARYALSRYLGTGTPIPTDMYFACLDGSWNDTHDQNWGEGFFGGPLDNPDLYAEVYVGRLPTSDVSDVTVMIDKTMAYATPVQMDYTDEVLLLAEVLFPPDWHDPEPIVFDGADLSEDLYQLVFEGKPLTTTRAYETHMYHPGSVELSKQASLDSMNAGVHIVNHIGHGSRFNFSCGDRSIVSADMDLLTNGDRLFMLFMVDCKVSAFDYACIAEHAMKNPNGGAVATIGASHLEFPAADSYYMNDFYDLSFNQHVVRIGKAFADCRLPRTPIAESGDNIHLWTHYVLTLLSDPELQLWTGAVETPDVFHVSSVGLGTTSILVNVTSGGQPVDSAHVCLSKDEDDYQYGATNSLGNVVLDFTAESPGTIKVVVTGLNLARHEGSITVDPSASAY
ncbi:MAG: hypothetical protein JSW58_06435, partial [Candidatus Latescibacterota bacterium]